MLKEKDILKRYEILKLLGEGGFSKVWLAMDVNINKQWAIKEIDKTRLEYKATVNERQTLNEIEIMSSLDHPALPRIVETIDEEDTLYIVMDYIEGESLKNILIDYGKQSQELVAAWGIEICEVLEYLHSQNPPIIYRDIKPSNIMLKPDGSIKIIDFGIARTYKEGKEDTMCFFTRGYSSPEHFTAKTDVRSDIYTVGTTMYHLLTGEDPRETPFDLKPIREFDETLSSGLEEIIKKATRMNPDERYQTARELRKAIANYKKLEISYIKELDRKLKVFKKMLVASFLTFTLASALFLFATISENNTYEALVNNENPSTELRVKELKQAIQLKPEKEDAYIKLVKEYSKDSFTESEASEFLVIYNTHKESLNERSRSFSNLNYEIGKSFLLYYTGKSDDSTRYRLLSAKTFFGECTNENYENYNLAKAYFELANFYEEYLTNSSELVSNEASSKTYKNLFERMEEIIDVKATTDEEQRLKLVAANIVLNLIDEERSSFVKKGMPQNDVISMITSLENRILELDSSKTSIRERKEEILERASLLKDKVKISYDNAKKGAENS